MDRVPVDSSTLRSVGYEDGTLELEFTSGAMYRYFGVPQTLHEALMRASSHGSFFNQHIRGEFPYVRLA